MLFFSQVSYKGELLPSRVSIYGVDGACVWTFAGTIWEITAEARFTTGVVVAARLVDAGIFVKAVAVVVWGVVVSGKVTSGCGNKVGFSFGVLVIELVADIEGALLATGTDFSAGVITTGGSVETIGCGVATGVFGKEVTVVVAAGKVVGAGKLVNAGAVLV